ncbi:rhamnulokinase family protein [Cellulomonas sp. URHE0023]|uniref:rhamnulokinase n=1 Tax=Cellulomonas sp. URHE0023 TaxID=1380354 RepID=UPI000486D75C|nr:rhamnulokinase family protein [Cellulomonas sp. URHE0023]
MGGFAAVDLGASSGRVMLGRVDRGRVVLDEVARFPNGAVELPGVSGLRWDLPRLWRGILDGLRAAAVEHGPLEGIGIDSWAVDYGLVDRHGDLVSAPVHYRDHRTDGVPDRVFAQVPAAELYARTGLQTQQFNTVFQLVAAQGTTDLAAADRMLLVPDLLGARLTGVQGAEITNASTTGLLDARTREWALDVAARLGVDTSLLPPLREPGTLLGTVRADLGLGADVPVWTVGSHDTASAIVAVPASAPDFAYISCGTWSLVGLELDAPVLTEASREANFTNEAGVDGTVRYLRNVMGLWVLQESMRTWREVDGDDVDLPHLLALAADVPALRTVVDIDAGEFLHPGDMPARLSQAARATGQPVPSSRAEVVRCILDSLAVAYRRAVRTAAELAGRDVRTIHLVGGGARNALLCQLTADATGLPVVAGPVEAAALGNVLIQARAAGVLDGDLLALRTIAARSAETVTYLPAAAGSDAPWAAAERRLTARD